MGSGTGGTSFSAGFFAFGVGLAFFDLLRSTSSNRRISLPTVFTILASSARSKSSFWFFVICSHFFAIIASCNKQEFVLSVADKDPVCRRKRMPKFWRQ